MKTPIFKGLQNIIFGLIISTSLMAEVKLPAIICDNMVLQQQTEATLWGTTSPNKKISTTTSWNGKNYYSYSDQSGSWEQKIGTPDASGPFEITISDGDTLVLRNILIGEVWICSGQSNMYIPVRGNRTQPIMGSNKVIATSKNKNIRLFKVDRNTNLDPQNDFSGSWEECIPLNVSSFCATGYFFGKMLEESLDVPVGLIQSSWGGTRIEPWISEKGLENFKGIDLPGKNQNISEHTPTVLYNAMINPMVNYTIRGVIWYQGESNRSEYDRYAQLMSGLVKDWRQAWGIGDFPFYYVQIAPFDYGNNEPNSAFLREAQLKASFLIPNSGMACTLDIGEKNCIHPSNKKAVGNRLAYIALAKTYGYKGFEYSGPVLKNMNVVGNKVEITFDHAELGLTTFGKELVNFKVAGVNQRFFAAQAIITNKGITLYSTLVEKPVAVRYAFDDFVIGELYNVEGLPASSFRTDDWDN